MTNNPKNRQQWIFDLLKVESLSYGDCYSKYSPIFSKTERTFNEDWKKATARLSEYQNKANKAKEIASISEEVNAIKSGLKSKIERAMFLQNEIEVMEKQLRGDVHFTFKIGNKINKSHTGDVFMLPIDEQNKIRQVIKEYQIEISKMEGDYAPTKIAETDVSGKDRKLPTGAKILYLGVDQLEDNEVNG